MKKIPCPACERMVLRLVSGVCLKCKAAFEKRNRRVVLEGGRERDHVRWTLADVGVPMVSAEDHAGMVAGEVHPVCEPEDRGNPLDAELTEATAEVRELGEALSAILRWVWRNGQKQRRPRPAVTRFMALSAVLNPDLFDGDSYQVIGAEFVGVTKAAVSKAAVQFQDEFGVHFRRSRKETAREHFRNAQLNRTQAK